MIKEAKSEKTTEGQTKKQEDAKEKLQKEHDFTPVSEEDEIPFDDFEDDCGFMDDLNEEIRMKEPEETSAYESARNYMRRETSLSLKQNMVKLWSAKFIT